MRLADKIIGALNRYSTAPRQHSDMDIELAEVMTDVATSTSHSRSGLPVHAQARTQQQRQHAESSGGDRCRWASGLNAASRRQRPKRDDVGSGL